MDNPKPASRKTASPPPEDPGTTLSGLLTRTVESHPEYIATTLNDADITYGDLHLKARAFARALSRLGIRRGDRVALLLPNSPTYVIAFYGAAGIGAIVANINVMAAGEELRGLLRDSGSKLVVTLDLFLQSVRRGIEGTPVEHVIYHSVFGMESGVEFPQGFPEPLLFSELVDAHFREEQPPLCRGDDIAVLQYTSGATGDPKAAVLTHRNIVSNVGQIDLAIPVEDLGNGAVICIIPFFHVFGMTVCLHLSVYKGYRMVLVPQFDWSSVFPLMEMIEKFRPVSFPAVSALWAALLSHPEASPAPLAAIRIASGGGAPLPSWVQENFRKLTGGSIIEAYGLSEASSTTHVNPPERPVSGSIGLPVPDTEAKIVDMDTGRRVLPPGEVGELIVRGPQVMKGYWNNPDLTRKTLRDGWLYTGDMARMDEDGYFFIVDRMDDLIITSGFNVYPSEVEAVLLLHEGVDDAAVVGLPDRIRGQVVAAFVVAAGEPGPAKSELIAHCRKHLAPYKVPRTVVFKRAVPQNPAGKPLRRILRQQASAENDS